MVSHGLVGTTCGPCSPWIIRPPSVERFVVASLQFNLQGVHGPRSRDIVQPWFQNPGHELVIAPDRPHEHDDVRSKRGMPAERGHDFGLPVGIEQGLCDSLNCAVTLCAQRSSAVRRNML